MSDFPPHASPGDQLDIAELVNRSLATGRFFVAPPYTLRIEHRPQETTPWEIFAGHLLDRSLTRQQQTFDAWHLYLDEASQAADVPLVSLRWQAPSQRLYVTRNILTHAHEAYESTPGVILTRPTQKWIQELVGTLDPAGRIVQDVQDEIGQLVLMALAGISRLPITSVESPLTEFALGRIGYLPQHVATDSATDGPLEFARRALGTQAAPHEQAKALETALRAISTEQTEPLAGLLSAQASDAAQLTGLLREVFNGAALSPYTGFSDRLVALVEHLDDGGNLGPNGGLQLLAHMLRQLCRHLTAFDLTLFHNFGANYPDALFLDTLLKALLRRLDAAREFAAQDQFDSRLVRRALRQAYLTRRHYEGQPVPDAPTSMGENARVLPPPFERVPEQQITDLGSRRKRLFADEPTDELFSTELRELLTRSVDELASHPQELRELGTAIYLDRPLGIAHAPGEVDRTPLVACQAYSRSIAVRRLAALKSAGLLGGEQKDELARSLTSQTPPGVRASELAVVERPGVVSLADANKAALDFVLQRSFRGSLAALIPAYDWRPLARRFASLTVWLLKDHQILVVPRRESPAAPPVIQFFREQQLNLELGFAGGPITMSPYRQRSGVELPERLQVLAARNADNELVDTSSEDIWITLKQS
jgi:hypothetical protein